MRIIGDNVRLIEAVLDPSARSDTPPKLRLSDDAPVALIIPRRSDDGMWWHEIYVHTTSQYQPNMPASQSWETKTYPTLQEARDVVDNWARSMAMRWMGVHEGWQPATPPACRHRALVVGDDGVARCFVCER